MGKYTLDDLRTMCILLEGHEEGIYESIYNRVRKAVAENRTNVRFSFYDKDCLAYKLENPNLLEKEIKVLEKVTGSKYSDWH